MPQRSSAVLLLGLSRDAWGAVPLPLALDFVGAPGCSLLCSLDTALAMQGGGGDATWEIAICDCANGIGRHFYVQAAVIDPGWNALGVVFSNGLDGVLGRL